MTPQDNTATVENHELSTFELGAVNQIMITPFQAFEIVVGRRLVNPRAEMVEFVDHAPARALQEFILLCRESAEVPVNNQWVEQAKITLQVRIGEDNIAASNAIIKQLTTGKMPKWSWILHTCSCNSFTRFHISSRATFQNPQRNDRPINNIRERRFLVL